jgi:hypothetical protein
MDKILGYVEWMKSRAKIILLAYHLVLIFHVSYFVIGVPTFFQK